MQLPEEERQPPMSYLRARAEGAPGQDAVTNGELYQV